MLNENLLIEKIKKGDIRSFETLISKYQLYAYNIAYRLMNNEEDAKDVTQESLIKIYKSIKDFNNKSNFSTWLYRIVINSCHDELRKRKQNTISLHQQNQMDSSEYQIHISDNSLNPEKILEKKERERIVQESINELPLPNKTIIILRDIQGFSYDEITQIINEPLGTIKSRISRSRNMLKQILIQKNNI